MRLYHGSNVQIIRPDISYGRALLDFGSGFYATSSIGQARAWAERKAARARSGIPTVNVYDFPDDALDDGVLSVRRFPKADSEWLDFVVANRNEEYTGERYDIVVGPVADDSVIRVIRMYMNGTYDRGEALKRFKAESLANQYMIASERAVRLLAFVEAKL